MTESYITLNRFMDLLEEHGRAELFMFDGIPCLFDECVGGEDWARVKFVNHYGNRFEMDAADLAGHYFNMWRL